MALNIRIFGVQLLCYLCPPFLHELFIGLKHLKSWEKSCTWYSYVWVNYESFDISFDLSEVGSINDERDGSEGIPSEVGAFVMDVFEEGGCDDVNWGFFFHLLDTDIYNSSEGSIFTLQKFGNGEEKLCTLILREVLSLIE
jgi:hypothetical protein